MRQAQLNTVRPGTRALAAIFGVIVITGSVSACSGVGPRGKPVVFGNQTNIIIWDAAHHTEHFIRNANFRSGADDFGFIAPTPSKPQLNEASNQAFYTLASLAPLPPMVKSFAAGGVGGGRDRSNEVKVIQEADVAGFHATTLFSHSAQAINDWMNNHGYVSTPEVEAWADRYTKRGWFLTAFKVVDKTKLAASTGTVRMSFRTDKPYNPFYVPSSNILVNKKGTLRVYFVSQGDYDANIGSPETIGTTEPWQTPQWTSPIPEPTAAVLAKQVEIKAKYIPKNAQVETFVDNDFPRPADDDIYFTKRPLVQRLRSAVPTPTRSNSLFLLSPFFTAMGLLAVARKRKTNA